MTACTSVLHMFMYRNVRLKNCVSKIKKNKNFGKMLLFLLHLLTSPTGAWTSCLRLWGKLTLGKSPAHRIADIQRRRTILTYIHTNWQQYRVTSLPVPHMSLDCGRKNLCRHGENMQRKKHLSVKGLDPSTFFLWDRSANYILDSRKLWGFFFIAVNCF